MPIERKFEIDWNANGDYDHALSDISGFVTAGSCQAGLYHPQQAMAQAAQAMVMVRNDDARWYPDNTASPYYGLLIPGLLLRIRYRIDGGSWAQLWEGRLGAFPTPPMHGLDPVVMLSAQGPMANWLNIMARVPSIALDQRIDQEISRVLSNSGWLWPYEGEYWVLGAATLGVTTRLPNTSAMLSLEAAKTTLDYAGDNTSATGVESNLFNAVNELVQDEMGGRLYWDARASKITFHNRHHDLLEDSEKTITTYYDHQSHPIYGDLLANRITVDYSVRELGTANQNVWELSGRWSVRAGESVQRRVSYKMSSYASSQVALYELSDPYPIRGTDWIAEDRYTVDVTDDVSFDVKAEARNALITITNNSDDTAYITTAQVRGQPLLVHPPEQVVKSDAASIAAHGMYAVQGGQYLLVAIADDSLASSWAGFALSNYKDPIHRVPSLDFPANEDTKTWLSSLEIGDCITLDWSLTDMEHNAEYIIIGEHHSFDFSQARPHLVSLVLKPKSALRGWRLGVEGYSELGSTTYLAF